MTQSDSGPSWPNTLTRQGRQALYTFTPFKLLRARGHSGYSVLLAPLHKLQVTPSFRWRSASSKSSFRVPLTDTWAKRVYQPHQLYSQTFTPGGQKFVFSLPPGKQQDTSNFSWPPTYLELSWDSLNGGYYCRLGL